jgi:hypothetical protein
LPVELHTAASQWREQFDRLSKLREKCKVEMGAQMVRLQSPSMGGQLSI